MEEGKKKEKWNRDERKEKAQSIPIFAKHRSEEEQRDKRSRWMEMVLMLRESVTGTNKSKRE